MADKEADVRWPGSAVNTEGRDLAEPTRKLLTQLNVLEDPDEVSDQSLKWKTPPSVQVITAGASSLTKWITAGIAALGGSSAVITWFAGLWNQNPQPSVRIAFVSFIGVVLV